MGKYAVATVVEIPAGARKLVTVNGRAIAIFNIKGEFFGLLNRCPHQGGSLCHGVLTSLIESDGPGQYKRSRQGEIIRCPWHGWEFDVRTGKSYCHPDRIKAKIYPVGVESGRTLVEGPYLAETLPVAVEDDYVVVTM